MKFSTVLFAASVAAFNSTETANTTVTETITSCEENGPCHTTVITTCPPTNSSISTFEGAAAGNAYAAAGAALLAAGAMLL
ncbi:DEKNAAC105355 [Brettanomyces naardenensis]|uniref:DEKNAAC105355 n=1 Tax=Brettanomyces naardenensis TaxID=13370 RepID=A0A448YTN3_BRENA|nr:DEKNAAC105355 [Brettanomyces naardenensis]